MEVDPKRHRYCVAVVGGATAGSAAAEILADNGVYVIVLEQNDRPYGKIEDGLPRWHAKQRRNEYERIDARLKHPGVFFVPRTRLGQDIGFDELTKDWGLSAVLLANGAWKDRPLQVPGVDDFLGRGLAYQNPFIYWFNHKNESSYSGPTYEVPQGTMVIGGGLASIDVVKAVQLELYGRALAARGVTADMYAMEHKGIPEYCRAHGIEAQSLGVQNSVLFYRRRVEDMPLATPPDNPTPEQLAKVQILRGRILSKAQEKYLFEFQPRHVPISPLVEGNRLVGLRFLRTVVENSRVTPVPGSEVEHRSELIISSIGSIPEPLEGVDMQGELYAFKSRDTGEYASRAGVFAAGNVVTGQGNIRVSLRHGQAVASHVVEKYLGVTDPNLDYRHLPYDFESMASEAAEELLSQLTSRPPMPGERVQAILQRVRERQAAVGYDGDYDAWIAKVTPADLE
jgi:ferredoxin/flavodoxin---NADP+ reductase